MFNFNKFKVLVCVCLFFALLSTANVPLFAVDAEQITASSFHGNITHQETPLSLISDTPPNLSNIEIEIYSAEEIHSTFDDGSDFTYYGLNYEFSVFTDATGNFTFNKPSDYFSLSINLPSLPSGYGISSPSEFYSPNFTSDTFSLSEISAIDTELVDGKVNVVLTDSSSSPIYADFTLIENPAQNTTYESLVTTNSLCISGTVATDTFSSPYTEIIDVSSHDVLSKIDSAYYHNLITEQDKFEYYCYALQDNLVDMDCTSELYQSIYDYRNSVIAPSTSDSITSTATAADTVRLIDDTLSEVYSVEWDTTNSVSGSIGNFDFTVFYGSDITSAQATAVRDEYVDIYNYFVTNRGFNAPWPHDSESYLIYISNDISDNGITYSYSDGTSYIALKTSTATGSNLARTLSHEFFHSVENTYGRSYITGNANKWFREGGTVLASLLYTGTSDSTIASYVNSYLTTSYSSIYNIGSNSRAYGAMVYPLYIYTYLGGWPAIKSIWNEIIDAGNVYDAITASSYVSTYQAAFSASCVRNYDVCDYYSLATSSWGTPNINEWTVPYSSASNLALSPMATVYHEFSSSSNAGTLNIAFDVSTNGGSGFYLNVIKTNSNGSHSIATIDSDFSSVVYPVSNFGSSSSRKITLVPVNTNNSGAAMSYSFSASLE